MSNIVNGPVSEEQANLSFAVGEVVMVNVPYGAGRTWIAGHVVGHAEMDGGNVIDAEQANATMVCIMFDDDDANAPDGRPYTLGSAHWWQLLRKVAVQ